MKRLRLLHCKASASTIAHIMERKYVFGVPFYRQEREWTQIGIHLDQNTMGSWIMRSAATWFKPIVERLHAYLLQKDVIQADETTVQVLKEARRKNTSKSYMWVFMGGELPKGNIGKAISYAVNQKSELTAFLEDGNVPIHNNACE